MYLFILQYLYYYYFCCWCNHIYNLQIHVLLLYLMTPEAHFSRLQTLLQKLTVVSLQFEKCFHNFFLSTKNVGGYRSNYYLYANYRFLFVVVEGSQELMFVKMMMKRKSSKWMSHQARYAYPHRMAPPPKKWRLHYYYANL